MSKVNAIIMAGGKSSRWYSTCSTPKHLIAIGGETLLVRQVRQLHNAGVDSITIVGPPEFNEGYSIEGVKTLSSRVKDNEHPFEYLLTDKRYQINKELISSDFPTLILLGDVFYSTAAFDTIMSFCNTGKSRYGFEWFGRPGIDRKADSWDKWGELWAIYIEPRAHSLLSQACRVIFSAKHVYTRELFTTMQRLVTPDFVRGDCVTPVSVIIDDMTNDFDYEYVLAEWTAKYSAIKKELS